MTGCVSHLGLQVDAGERHLGDLVEADGERDGAEDEERVVDGDTHQNDALDLSEARLHQQSTGQIDQKEQQTHAEEQQIERKPADAPEHQHMSRQLHTQTLKYQLNHALILQQLRRELRLGLEENLPKQTRFIINTDLPHTTNSR